MQINITYDQILSLEKQLSLLLNTFHTDELSLDTIDKEVEIVRQQIYDRKKLDN